MRNLRAIAAHPALPQPFRQVSFMFPGLTLLTLLGNDTRIMPCGEDKKAPFPFCKLDNSPIPVVRTFPHLGRPVHLFPLTIDRSGAMVFLSNI
jgi:hypothetical protein